MPDDNLIEGLLIGGAVGALITYIACSDHRYKHKPRHKRRGQIEIYFIIDNNLKFGGIIMSLTFNKKQRAVGTLKVTDKNGDEAKYQPDSLKAVIQDEAVATASVNEKGEIVLLSTGLGATVLDIELDANLTDDGDATTGDDVRAIKAQITIEVVGLEAEAVNVEFAVTDVVDEPPV